MFHLANAVQPLFRLWWYPHEAGRAKPTPTPCARMCAPRIEAAWDRLDAHLAAHGPYLLGDTLSRGRFLPDHADALVAQHAAGRRRTGRTWRRWRSGMKARPSFKLLYEREGLTEWA